MSYVYSMLHDMVFVRLLVWQQNKLTKGCGVCSVAIMIFDRPEIVYLIPKWFEAYVLSLHVVYTLVVW